MINLGDKVKDNVSGFQGIAVAKHSYLEGCDRFSIQPPIDKDGKLPSCEAFDEPQLKVIKAGEITVEYSKRMKTKKPGGPEKYSDPGKEVASRR